MSRQDEAMLSESTEELPVKLTDDELLDFGQRLAKLEADIEGHQLHEVDVRREMKAARAVLDKEQRRLAGIIRAKSEQREVRVQHWARYPEGKVDTIRTDTGDVVESRPMHANERQSDLPLDGLWGDA